jgi:hypothetical protein
MEESSNILAPMEEKLIEYFVDDEVIDGLFELLVEDEVEFIEDGEQLLQEVGVLGLKNALYSRVEVIIVKIVRKFLVIVQDYSKVALNQVQTFYHAERLEQMGLGEDQHHECSKQLLVFY